MGSSTMLRLKNKASENDFFSILKTTPTLKGVDRDVPLGNKKGGFSKNIKSQKSILGC